MPLSISDYQLQLEQEIAQIQKNNEQIEISIQEIWQRNEVQKIEIQKNLSQSDFSGNDNWITIEYCDPDQLFELSENQIFAAALEIFDLE